MNLYELSEQVCDWLLSPNKYKDQYLAVKWGRGQRYGVERLLITLLFPGAVIFM